MNILPRSLFALATALTFAAAPAAAGELKLTLSNGRVTLVAKDVTVREILAEWARVGQTRIVNGEKLIGAPVTIELHDVPEAQALDTILRSAAGYVMAPRMAGTPGASVYDRILILATSRPPAATPPAARAQAAPPMRQAPPAVLNDLPDDDQDPPIGPNPVAMPGLNAPGYPGQNQFGQMPPQGMPMQPQMPPQVPVTASRPGIIAAPPVQTPPAPNAAPYFNPTLPGVVPPAPTTTRPGGRGGGGQ